MKNIVILTTSLTNGGTERFAITLYKMLTTLSYNVYIVTINDINKLGFSTADKYFSLENNVSKKNTFLKPFLLKNFLKDKNIDLIIDNRTKHSLLKTLIYEIIIAKHYKIKMVHSYNYSSYFFQSHFLNHFFFDKYKKIVCVSTEIKNKIFEKCSFKNLDVIHNPLPDITLIPTSINLPPKYILFFGRLHNESKNLFFLLNAYKKSKLSDLGIQLILLGSGPDYDIIKLKIKELDLENHIILIPSLENPFQIVKNAMFTVLTSHYEGFPMSMIESLSLGVPVVCTNFKSGVSEIMINEHNGLVTNKNLDVFSSALYRMATDNILLQHCKKNSANSVKHLSRNEISKSWKSLIDNI